MQGHQHHVLKGAAFMVAAMLTFCIVNVVVKETAAAYPILQLVFFRNALALVPMLARPASRHNAIRAVRPLGFAGQVASHAAYAAPALGCRASVRRVCCGC